MPVSGSSATTRLAAGRYITPFTTMGVASEFGAAAPPRPAVGGAGASLCKLYVHALVSVPTFVASIWVSGE